MKRILILTTVIAFVLGSTVFAGQEQKTKKEKTVIKRVITLEKAVEMAMKRDEDYKNAALEVEISRTKITQAKAARWPSISATVSGTGMWNPDKLAGVDTWMNNENFTIVGSLEVSLSMPLYTFGKLSHSIALAKDEFRVKKITLEKVEKQLKLKVKNVFYGYIIAKEQYKVAQNSFRLNKSNYEITRRNFLRGLKPEIEVLQIQVSLETARSQMLSSQTNLKKVKNDLEDLIGPVVNEKGTVIKGDLETDYLKMPLDTAIKRAFSNNHDIAIAEMGYSMAKHNRVIIASNAKPMFNFFAGYTLSHSPDTEYKFSGMPPVPSQVRVGSKAYQQIQFGIQIMLPISEILYPKSINKTKAQIAGIDYEIEKTANQIKKIKDSIRLQLVNHYNNLEVLEKQIKMYRKLIKVARRNLRLANVRYRGGNMDYLTMRNIENQYLSVILQFNKYLYDYILIKTQVLHLTQN